jgi:hypothetical protein
MCILFILKKYFPVNAANNFPKSATGACLNGFANFRLSQL